MILYCIIIYYMYAIKSYYITSYYITFPLAAVPLSRAGLLGLRVLRVCYFPMVLHVWCLRV